MSPQISWSDVALRLFLTVLAGALIGINREKRAHSAGLRTTMLVCLAASVSMIQVNLLLGMSGKTPSSFVVMDLMRLPLGILSGMGFIGAGAILRKEGFVTGITTAATLWFTTVMGLCFGGGQLGLGIIALLLAIFILQLLKGVEKRWKRGRGLLTLVLENGTLDPNEISRQVESGGGKIAHWSAATFTEARLRNQSCEILWNHDAENPKLPAFLQSLSTAPGVLSVEWKISSEG